MPDTESRKEGAFIFAPGVDPDADMKPVDPTLIIETPYVAPNIPSIPEILHDHRGVVRYKSAGIWRYGTFQWLKAPRALVLELPFLPNTGDVLQE